MYEQAINYGHIGALNNIGYLNFIKGNFEIAEEWYFRAIDAGYLGAMYNLAELYEMRERFEEAKIWYEKARDEAGMSVDDKLRHIEVKKGLVN